MQKKKRYTDEEQRHDRHKNAFPQPVSQSRCSARECRCGTFPVQPLPAFPPEMNARSSQVATAPEVQPPELRGATSSLRVFLVYSYSLVSYTATIERIMWRALRPSCIDALREKKLMRIVETHTVATADKRASPKHGKPSVGRRMNARASNNMQWESRRAAHARRAAKICAVKRETCAIGFTICKF
jgi:hypothetical protein